MILAWTGQSVLYFLLFYFHKEVALIFIALLRHNLCKSKIQPVTVTKLNAQDTIIAEEPSVPETLKSSNVYF